MIENLFHLPTFIQVKTLDNSTEHYIVDGDILKKSETCILLEGTTLWKKSSEKENTPSLLYDKSEGKRPYVVVLFDKYYNFVDKKHEHHAKFFNNLNDAQRYYSCFAMIDLEGIKVG